MLPVHPLAHGGMVVNGELVDMNPQFYTYNNVVDSNGSVTLVVLYLFTSHPLYSLAPMVRATLFMTTTGTRPALTLLLPTPSVQQRLPSTIMNNLINYRMSSSQGQVT